MSPKPYDVLVIGGGPAGLAAGVEAANGGLSVAIVDERPTRAARSSSNRGPVSGSRARTTSAGTSSAGGR